MKKAIIIIVLISLFGLLFLIAAFFLFNAAENNHKKNQEAYFAKVSYKFNGIVVDYEFLGGITSLIKVKLDKSNFIKIELK